MSAFKDMVANDIESVFLNLDEFADKHLWDGKELVCVVDDDTMIEKYSAEFDLLPKGSHLVYASAASFEKRPQVSSVVRFDKIIYTIDEIEEQMGMYRIFLARGNV